MIANGSITSPIRCPHRHHQWATDEEAERADNTIFVCLRLWTQTEARAFELYSRSFHHYIVCLVAHSFGMHRNTHTNTHIETCSILSLCVVYIFLVHTDIYYVVNVFKPDLAYDLIRYNVSSSTMSTLSSCVLGICECYAAVQFFGATVCAHRIGYHLRRRVISGMKSTRWDRCTVRILRAYEVAMGSDKLFQYFFSRSCVCSFVCSLIQCCGCGCVFAHFRFIFSSRSSFAWCK